MERVVLLIATGAIVATYLGRKWFKSRDHKKRKEEFQEKLAVFVAKHVEVFEVQTLPMEEANWCGWRFWADLAGRLPGKRSALLEGSQCS